MHKNTGKLIFVLLFDISNAKIGEESLRMARLRRINVLI